MSRVEKAGKDIEVIQRQVEYHRELSFLDPSSKGRLWWGSIVNQGESAVLLSGSWSLFCLNNYGCIVEVLSHKWAVVYVSLRRWGRRPIKTVLLQGHFYSLHLLFASANKTTFQSRMIECRLILITGKSEKPSRWFFPGWSSVAEMHRESMSQYD